MKKLMLLKEIIQPKKVKLDQILTPDIRKLVDIFYSNGFELRMVGGAVRDLVLGKYPKDIDLATTATPTQMLDLAKREKLKVIPTGLQHGTVTFIGPVSNKEPFEITTLRVDVETDGRHAKVEYTKSWKKDAERRDLTYNAMSIDLKTGKLYDYFSGLEDLKNKKTSFVGNASSRIQEDYLRILRIFRFAARYNSIIDNETKQAIKENAKNLEKISGERIWMELSKILSGPNTNKILQVMKETNVTDILNLPLVHLNKLTDVKNRTDNPITLLSTLVNINEFKKISNKWKFSKLEYKLGEFLLTFKDKSLNINTIKELLVRKYPKDWIKELAAIKNVNFDWNWTIPEFPLSGNDLIELGFKPGPEFSKMLENLKRKWIASDYKLSKQDLVSSLEI